MEVVRLVRKGLSKTAAYEKIPIDRNTICNQAPIAELATVSPDDYMEIRETYLPGDSLFNFTKDCATQCESGGHMQEIQQLKRKGDLLDISKR